MLASFASCVYNYVRDKIPLRGHVTLDEIHRLLDLLTLVTVNFQPETWHMLFSGRPSE